MRVRAPQILAAMAMLLPAPAALFAQSANPAELQIKADQITARVNPLFYGLMTEEINYSYDGGLYAELVRNRNFKEDSKEPAHWQLVQERGGTGSVSLDPTQPFNDAAPASLKLTIAQVSGDQRVGVALNVRGTRIFDGTLAIVSGLPQLDALDIAYTQITENGLDGLVTLTQLKELSIGRSRLGNRALDVLRLLPTLEYLDLGGPHPGGGGGAMPEDIPRAISTLRELRVLKLGYSQIGMEGLRILQPLDKLEKLMLECCPRVGDEALAELAKWKTLKYLDVQETKVTDSGVAALRKARPEIAILSGTYPRPPS